MRIFQKLFAVGLHDRFGGEAHFQSLERGCAERLVKFSTNIRNIEPGPGSSAEKGEAEKEVNAFAHKSLRSF